MSVSVATVYVNNEKVLKIIDTSASPQIAGVHISANENTITATFTGVGGSTSGFNCILDCEIYNTNYTYTKVSNFELVITAPVLLEPFDGDATVGNNSTINLVYNPYNITTSKPKIVIHCEEKVMANNLVITNEIYMGEYEEIVSGFTLTLMQNTKTNYAGVITSNTYAEYSLDNGNTWTKFYGLSLPLVLENVSTISFRVAGGDGSSGAFIIGTTSTSSDVADLNAQQSTIITITENKTLYIGSFTGPHSGGAGD